MAARRAHNPEVPGSSPGLSTNSPEITMLAFGLSKQNFREVVTLLRPDIDDAEFESAWLLYVASHPDHPSQKEAPL
jgi:hypothetical protein